MAIKGKKRTKGRPRGVATAPRPFLVPPKTPLFRRPGVQLSLILLLLGLIALLGWGLRSTQDAGQRREGVERFRTQLDSAIASTEVGAPMSIPGSAPLILPDLAEAVRELETEGARTARIVRRAPEWRQQAEEARDAVSNLRTDVPELELVRDQITLSFQLYANVAREVRLTAQLDGDQRNGIASALQEDFAVAAQLFDRGWQLLLEQEETAGIEREQPQPEGGFPPGFPGGGQQPGFPGGEVPGLPGP